MEKRKLGKSQIAIAPLMFGGNVFGWTTDEAMSFRLLDAFVGAGFNAIDTADVYSKWVAGHRGGESEAIIGAWLKARGGRDKVVIATKVGLEMPGIGQGLKASYILARVEDSLKRLNTDYIDIYQSHQDDQSTPLEETLGAYQKLMAQGKVRVIGASNYQAPRLAEALQTSTAKSLPRYESLQPLYNLYDRDQFEPELAALTREKSVGVIPYYSLAAGFLSGKYRTPEDVASGARASRVAQRYLNERGKRVLAGLDQAAKATGRTQAQIALAWLLSHDEITAPIASATTLAQLAELAPAAGIVLDAATRGALDEASRIGA